MKIEGISSQLNVQLPKNSEVSTDKFNNLLKDFIAEVNSDLKSASEAKELLMQGKVNNMVELMASIEKADISLRLATEIRNKVIEAYQDIMRMQI